jgi:hypothetical protein
MLPPPPTPWMAPRVRWNGPPEQCREGAIFATSREWDSFPVLGDYRSFDLIGPFLLSLRPYVDRMSEHHVLWTDQCRVIATSTNFREEHVFANQSPYVGCLTACHMLRTFYAKEHSF